MYYDHKQATELGLIHFDLDAGIFFFGFLVSSHSFN